MQHQLCWRNVRDCGTRRSHPVALLGVIITIGLTTLTMGGCPGADVIGGDLGLLDGSIQLNGQPGDLTNGATTANDLLDVSGGLTVPNLSLATMQALPLDAVLATDSGSRVTVSIVSPPDHGDLQIVERSLVTPAWCSRPNRSSPGGRNSRTSPLMDGTIPT